MDNSTIISIISIIFGMVFWIFIFYFIIRLFRAAIKKKQAPRTEVSPPPPPRPAETVKEEIKKTAEEAVKPRSKLSKILRWRATTWKGKLLVLGTAMILIPVLLAIFLPDDDYQTDTAEPNAKAETYYVKTSAANVRECPQLSCKILGMYPQNTELAFPGELFDKYPDWVEVTFPDGGIGYISKTVLSENKTSASEYKISAETPRGNGIALGEGDFEPLVVGYSYDISFCMPESARSGATCGGLAGDTSTPVGGSPPYSLVKGSGFFPPGMSLELNGLLSGAPTTEGTYNFQICAKDLKMNQGCQNYALVVKGASDIISNQPKDELIPPAQEESSISPWVSIDSASCEIVGVNSMFSTQDYPYYLYLIKASGEVAGNIDTVLSLHENPSSFGGQIQNPVLTGGWETIYWKNYPDASNELLRVSGNPATTAWSHSAGGGFQRTKSKSVEVSATLYGNKDKTIFLGSDETTVVCSL